MVIEKREAVKILKQIARNQAAWTKDYGRIYSVKVVRALEMGAKAIEVLEERQEESMNKVKVLVKGPRCPAHVEYVENTLEALQNLVRGYIEVVTIEDGWCILCDEEGRIKHRYPNCEIEGIDFVGKIVLIGFEGEEFSDFDMVDEFKERYPQLWKE